jgi:hypothetical protein
MLVAYRFADTGPDVLPLGSDGRVPPETGWVDVFQPTPDEDRATEAFLGASLPTREETQEIEFSSRFYTEDNAVYMTAPLLTGIDIGKPVLTPFHHCRRRRPHRDAALRGPSGLPSVSRALGAAWQRLYFERGCFRRHYRGDHRSHGRRVGAHRR